MSAKLARHKVSKSCRLQNLSSHPLCSQPHPKVSDLQERTSVQALGHRPCFHDSAPEREPQSLLQALVLSPALSSPAFLHTHGPMAWYGGERPLAWSDPCSGLGLCLLAHLSLASSGKATCLGSHEGREGGAWEPRETGSAIWSMTCPGMALCWGQGREGGHSWWEDISPSWRDRPGSLGTLLVGAANRTLWTGVIEVAHTSPQILTFITG